MSGNATYQEFGNLQARQISSEDNLRVADDSELSQIASALHARTRRRAKLEQTEMVGIFGLQRAHQDIKCRQIS
jgi:hypothetical protein